MPFKSPILFSLSINYTTHSEVGLHQTMHGDIDRRVPRLNYVDL